MGEAVAPPLAVVELLDRDGQVRQSVAVHAWPVTLGRAIDNQIVLADPHVAAHHLRITAADAGVGVEVGDTVNGAQLGARHLGAGAAAPIAPQGAPALLTIGRTRLRLRLPGHALDPELPLAVGPASLWQRRGVLAAGIAALLATLVLRTWLDADPDVFGRAFGGTLLTFAASVAVWCGAWALLSRIFTRQAQFGWHLRVFVFGSLVYLAVETLAAVLAFALGWAWIADFSFVGTIAVAGAALAFHLYAVEPSRLRLMRGVGAVAALGGIALTLYFNHQRTDRLGSDLYMSHLMPPALRLARTAPVDRFVDGLAALQEPLDRKAREPVAGDGDEDDEE
jgi:hypothetical protein